MKKTAWYPAKIKPVREGLYEVRGCEFFRTCAGGHVWEDGAWWVKVTGARIPTKALPWRGVAK